MNKENLKIVFFGTPEFAVESLDRLVVNGFNIVGVVTATDKPAGRGHRMLASAVKEYAVGKGLKVLQPERLKDPEFIDELRSLDADLFVVIAFRMLPEAVWQMPRLGTFNLHASLLPKYRGAAPINWAVINGDTETGVTTFFLKHEIDTGDIIDQERIAILPGDNAGDVHDRLMHLGAELTLKTVNNIVEGNVAPVPQERLINDVNPAPAPKIYRDTCHIDLSKNALDVHNLVRGLSPYPAAWIETELTDGTYLSLKVFSTEIEEGSVPPLGRGKVYSRGGQLYLGACDRPLRIVELQPAGKKRMGGSDFLRGTAVGISL